jgi:hypothetical protein
MEATESGREAVGNGSSADETREQVGGASGQHERDDFKVIVNGREREVDHRRLTFEEVVRLAFDPVPTGPNVVLTVSYRHAAEDRKGTLIEGQSVEIKNHGTVFNVTATDKS